MLAEHLSKTVRARLKKLLSTRSFASASDPVEALHDLRVASRRLRAFVDVFEPLLGTQHEKRTRRSLRDVTRAVRALRDWDVQLALIGGRMPRAQTDLERAGIEFLLERATAERAREAIRAERKLEKVDFGELERHVELALANAVGRLPEAEGEMNRLAWTLLEPFVSRLEEAHFVDDGAEHVEQLHALRIDAKRLRYALELFEPLLSPKHRAVMGRVRDLQDVIGEHRDVTVLEDLVAGVHAELVSRGRVTLGAGLMTLRSALAPERRSLFEKYLGGSYKKTEWRRDIRKALF
jgi:CHAD domain-containing protein